jgi:predicted RNase H-like nuclease
MTMIIGIDCATQHQKTGLARARLVDKVVTIEAWELASATRAPETIISEWLNGTPTALLALDAPLGWPEKLGIALVEHTAGSVLTPEADALFHRYTDRDVKDRLGKRPLEVGADRIARTARRALELLNSLRQALHLDIPLTWEPGSLEGVQAIEVYPAATLLARQVGKQKKWKRFCDLGNDVNALDHEEAPDQPDVRDAIVCAVAGADFLMGRVTRPQNMKLAEKEGWIWVRELTGKES